MWHLDSGLVMRLDEGTSLLGEVVHPHANQLRHPPQLSHDTPSELTFTQAHTSLLQLFGAPPWAW